MDGKDDIVGEPAKSCPNGNTTTEARPLFTTAEAKRPDDPGALPLLRAGRISCDRDRMQIAVGVESGGQIADGALSLENFSRQDGQNELDSVHR